MNDKDLYKEIFDFVISHKHIMEEDIKKLGISCYWYEKIMTNVVSTTCDTFIKNLYKDSNRTKEIYIAILMELKKMKNTLVEKDELEKAKNQLISGESFVFESNFSLLRRYFKQYVVSGKVLSFKESTDAIKKVTAKQIQNCAKKIFKKENFAIAVLGSSTITKKSLEKEMKSIL